MRHKVRALEQEEDVREAGALEAVVEGHPGGILPT